mmetsp:Transcript_6092/g.7960  ORF Transcript_6092/g.7960 Transcript_6092/m.7960 type:complete len:427 (-) Transcript_6092:723-2003(-)
MIASSTEFWDLLEVSPDPSVLENESLEQPNYIAEEIRSAETLEEFLSLESKIHGEVEGEDGETATSVSTPEAVDSSTMNAAKKKKKKEYVAAAMRKSRAKRKVEREEMKLRSAELEREQIRFKLQIAQLQNEIEALKNCQKEFGYVDLATENRILKAELKRHKSFVYAFKNMAANMPTYTREEKLRVAKTGADSLIGQILGLCYTSVAEGNAWQTTTVPLYEDVSLEVKYQYLPLGATWREAKRINARFEFVGHSHFSGEEVNLNSKKFKAALWNQYGKDTPMEQMFRSLFQVESEWEEIHIDDDGVQQRDISASPETNSPHEEDENCHDKFWNEEKTRIKLLSYKETSVNKKFEKPLDSVVLVVSSDEEVRSSGFPKSSDCSKTDATTIPAHVFGSTFAIQDQSSIELHPVQEGVKRTGCSFYEG